MARIFQDGFELGVPVGPGTTITGSYNNSLWQFNQTSVSTNLREIGVSTIAKSGSHSLRIYHSSGVSATCSIYTNLESAFLELFGRVEFRYDVTVLTNPIIHFRDSSFVYKASIRLLDTGELALYMDNTLIETSTITLNTGSFYRIEWHIKVDPIEGVIEVKVDGTTILSFQGDTSIIGDIQYFCLGKNANSANNTTYYYDDIAINDTTTLINNSWCGVGYILLLKPNEETLIQDFEKSNSLVDAHNLVNTVPPNGDTSYLFSDTFGNISILGIESLTGDKGVSLAQIKAVQLCSMSRYEEEPTSFKQVLRLGGINYEGIKYNADITYNKIIQEIYQISPTSNDVWEMNELEELGIGIKHEDIEG